jgi:hypothetical protein
MRDAHIFQRPLILQNVACRGERHRRASLLHDPRRNSSASSSLRGAVGEGLAEMQLAIWIAYQQG